MLKQKQIKIPIPTGKELERRANKQDFETKSGSVKRK